MRKNMINKLIDYELFDGNIITPGLECRLINQTNVGFLPILIRQRWNRWI
jgi:hypothetical protein